MIVTEDVSEPDNTTLNYCVEFCNFLRGGEQAKLQYNQSSETFSCQCFDYSKELILNKEITARDLELYQQKKVKWENMPIIGVTITIPTARTTK